MLLAATNGISTIASPSLVHCSKNLIVAPLCYTRVVDECSKTIQIVFRAAFMPVISTASCPRLFRLHCPGLALGRASAAALSIPSRHKSVNEIRLLADEDRIVSG